MLDLELYGCERGAFWLGIASFLPEDILHAAEFLINLIAWIPTPTASSSADNMRGGRNFDVL
jgi:hypothetical protein